MACMTAETGTLIYSIINIIIVCFKFILCLGGSIYSMTDHGPSPPRQGSFYVPPPPPPPPADALTIFIFIAVLLSIVISLVFSSLLLHGILKKKPRYLKAYVEYGKVEMAIRVCRVIRLLILRSGYSVLIPIMIAYVVVFISILVMIKCAYTKMETGTGLLAKKPEEENCQA